VATFTGYNQTPAVRLHRVSKDAQRRSDGRSASVMGALPGGPHVEQVQLYNVFCFYDSFTVVFVIHSLCFVRCFCVPEIFFSSLFDVKL